MRGLTSGNGLGSDEGGVPGRRAALEVQVVVGEADVLPARRSSASSASSSRTRARRVASSAAVRGSRDHRSCRRSPCPSQLLPIAGPIRTVFKGDSRDGSGRPGDVSNPICPRPRCAAECPYRQVNERNPPCAGPQWASTNSTRPGRRTVQDPVEPVQDLLAGAPEVPPRSPGRHRWGGSRPRRPAPSSGRTPSSTTGSRRPGRSPGPGRSGGPGCRRAVAPRP